MRVLQLIDTLNPGGAERVAVSYANALAEQLDGSFLCTTRMEGDLKQQLDPEVGYLFLKKRSAYDMSAIRRLMKYCKTHNIDIIHAHTSSYFTATLATYLLKDVGLIWHDHYGKSEQLSMRPKKVLRWCSRRFKAILAVNETLVGWAMNNLNCPEVIYFKNAVPILDPQKIMAAELPGVEGSRILMLANLRAQKDHINAILAVKEVRKKYPDLSLHLLGLHWDDDYYQQIRLQMDQQEEREFIHYHGSKQNVNAYIKACDLGILSSNSEGLPMALLEYAAMQLPVVCTRVGQCEAVIQSDGYLVPPADYKALAHAISEALNNRQEAQQKAAQLLKRIEAEYSIQTIIPKLLTVYASIH